MKLGYLILEPVDRVWLIGGLAYDAVNYPANFRNPTLSAGQEHNSQLGPKGGLVWNPLPLMTLRGASAKSLGGVSADESYRLEQTQLAGQENVYLGYRFLRRRAEVMFGVLNLSDQDYQLNPLSTYMELPRERAYVLRVNFIF